MLVGLINFIEPVATFTPSIVVADHEALILDITFHLSVKLKTDTFLGGRQPSPSPELDAMSKTKTETVGSCLSCHGGSQ